MHPGTSRPSRPKTNLPNYREFYEPPSAAPPHAATRDVIESSGIAMASPFGNNLSPARGTLSSFHAECGEDLWVPIRRRHTARWQADLWLRICRPQYHELAKAELPRSLVTSSARCPRLRLSSRRESAIRLPIAPGTVMRLIADNGRHYRGIGALQDEPANYSPRNRNRRDLDARQERMRQGTFGDTRGAKSAGGRSFAGSPFRWESAAPADAPRRSYERLRTCVRPATRASDAPRFFETAVKGLATRLRAPDSTRCN